MLSYCGSIDAKIRASDKDLPVPVEIVVDSTKNIFSLLIFVFRLISKTVWTGHKNLGLPTQNRLEPI